MNEDANPQIDGMEIIDATQNAVIEAVDNVSGMITETTAETQADNHHHEIFYKTAEFWVGFAFILVVVVLARPVGGLLKSMLVKRRDEIADRISQAEKLHDDAQKLLADYERKFVHAEEEAGEVLEKSQRQIEQIRRTENHKLEAEMALKRKEAENLITSAQLKTSAEINSQTTQKAVRTAKAFIKNNITSEQQSALIDLSIDNVVRKITTLS